MSLSIKDTTILRGLGQRLAEIAALPIQKEKAELWRRLNRLERVRPMVCLYNLTWEETKGLITLESEDPFARDIEWDLRKKLFHWDNMKDDTVYEPVVYSQIIDTRKWMFEENHYGFVVEDNLEPDIPPAPIAIDWEGGERNYQQMCEIFDGILRVEKRGENGYGTGILDHWVVWRGMDKCFTDLIDNPDWVHRWLNAMVEWHLHQLGEYERLGYLNLNNGANAIDPGGLGFTDELPQPDFDGTHVRAKDMWGMTAAQIFAVVSPSLHEEFAIPHDSRILQQFGLACYGCCEPLDKKIDIIKKGIPNLRRVSISPWADVARSSEGLGKDFVFSCKPNPALLGMEGWDISIAEKYLRDALSKTRENVVEVIMKDLHTVRNEPQRMTDWVNMAMRLAEEYA